MIEEGRHKGRAVSATLGVSDTGSEQIGVMFVITEGNAKNSTVSYRGFFTDATFERTIESLRYMGWTGNDLSVFLDVDEVGCYELLPDEVELVVEHEQSSTADGRVFPKVRWINKICAGSVSMKNKMDKASAKAFAERLLGACVAAPVSAGKQSAQAQDRNNQRVPAQSQHVQQSRQQTPARIPPGTRVNQIDNSAYRGGTNRNQPPPGFFDEDPAEQFQR